MTKMTNTAEILNGDVRQALASLPDQSVQTVITSPPYWGLRDYGTTGQLGQEDTPYEFVENLVEIFRDVKRVLKDDGTVWLNLGDSYVGTGHKGEHKDPKYSNGRNGQTTALNNKVDGLKSKDLIGIPWRVAFALQEDGWYLRQDIIWAKPNPMPESVKDRCTKSHEYIFLLSKKPKYFFDHVAMKEPATTKNGKPRQFGASNQVGTLRNDEGRVFEDTGLRNKRDVWFVSTKPYKGAHFAVYPTALIEPCVLAGSRPNDTVLDIFSGSGTTGVVALQNNRNYIGIEINKDYAELSEQRLTTEVGVFGSITVKSVEN
jgi:DNA modification methylase